MLPDMNGVVKQRKPLLYTGKHRAADTDWEPEPECTCGQGIACCMKDHDTWCAIMLDLYRRHVLTPPPGVCRECGFTIPCGCEDKGDDEAVTIVENTHPL